MPSIDSNSAVFLACLERFNVHLSTEILSTAKLLIPPVVLASQLIDCSPL